MKAISFAAFAALPGLLCNVAARPSGVAEDRLEANLAYRSPSTTVDLSIPLEGVRRKLAKRDDGGSGHWTVNHFV